MQDMITKMATIVPTKKAPIIQTLWITITGAKNGSLRNKKRGKYEEA